MTNSKRIFKEARKSGKVISPEIKSGLRAIEKLHELSAKCKESPSKIYEQVHHGLRK